MFFNIWWLYISLISPIILQSFEVVSIVTISNLYKLTFKIIVIWEYG